jgi:hypothetical protein
VVEIWGVVRSGGDAGRSAIRNPRVAADHQGVGGNVPAVECSGIADVLTRVTTLACDRAETGHGARPDSSPRGNDPFTDAPDALDLTGVELRTFPARLSSQADRRSFSKYVPGSDGSLAAILHALARMH